MTGRAWQKDWEMCQQATPGPWYGDGNQIWRIADESTWIATLERDVEEFPANLCFIAEAREALPYWLQRVKDLEWLKEAAEELLDQYLAGELKQPCRVLLSEDAVCRDECYTDCAARRLQTVLKKLQP